MKATVVRMPSRINLHTNFAKTEHPKGKDLPRQLTSDLV